MWQEACRATPALRGVLSGLAQRTDRLLDEGAPLALMVRDPRLAMEIATIGALARRLVALLRTRDPLSERVHLGKGAMLGIAALASAGVLGRRFARAPERRDGRAGARP